MAQFLTLRGRSALSAFRVNKLLADLAATRIAGITADYFHFVAASRSLSADERVTLERLLTYGPLTVDHVDAGELLLVIGAQKFAHYANRERPIPLHARDRFHLRHHISPHQIRFFSNHLAAGRDAGGRVREIQPCDIEQLAEAELARPSDRRV